MLEQLKKWLGRFENQGTLFWSFIGAITIAALDIISSQLCMHWYPRIIESNPLLRDSAGRFLVWAAIGANIYGLAFVLVPLSYVLYRLTGRYLIAALPFLYDIVTRVNDVEQNFFLAWVIGLFKR